MSKVDVDALPPTQQLVLEVLAARTRLGEQFWPFPNRLMKALNALEAHMLVGFEADVMPGHQRAWLTDYGVEAILSPTYTVPEQRTPMHMAAIVPAMKMDARDLWQGICTAKACKYRGAIGSAQHAYGAAATHAAAKNADDEA